MLDTQPPMSIVWVAVGEAWCLAERLATKKSDKPATVFLGDRLMAGQQILALLIGVRIPVSQPVEGTRKS